MKLIEKLDCKLEKGDVFTLVSGNNTGKSTILCQLAYDLVQQGKNVIYVSNEVNNKTIYTKFKNIMLPKENLKGSLVIKTNVNAIGFIRGDIPKNTDVVVLDGYFGNKADYQAIAEEKQISIMEVRQVDRDVFGGGMIIGDRNKFMQRSSFVLGVNRTRVTTELTLLDKVKNKLCFWLPKTEVAENLVLQVVKNRRGRTGYYDHKVNFEKINKK